MTAIAVIIMMTLNMFINIKKQAIKSFLHCTGYFFSWDSTAAVSTECALAELMNHPDIMEKAREEINAVVEKSRVVEELDVINLPYLQYIVKETLRFHPAGAPLIMRESIANCTIRGY